MRVTRPQRESKYLSAELLGPDFVEIVRIAQVTKETIGGEEKFVIYFTDHDKALPLNATNIDALIDLFGEESDAWLGRPIELFTTATRMENRRVLGIRVRATTSTGRPQPRPVPPSSSSSPRRRDREPGEDDQPVHASHIKW